jgi:hypothetical protein
MKSDAHILGFAARINGVVHPAAVFKFSGEDAYWWDCHHPSNGCTIIFETGSLPVNKSVPLSQGKVFRSVTDQHRSHHASGRRHLAIEASGRKKEYTTKYKSIAIPDIKTWENLSSIQIPLIGEFFANMDAAPWRIVKRPEILETQDFNGACGVCLHAYICRTERLDDLIRNWRKNCTRHWIAGAGPFRLIVLAEPL